MINAPRIFEIVSMPSGITTAESLRNRVLWNSRHVARFDGGRTQIR